ncbi:MAG: DUF4386 family protein [Nitrososphaera sp.]
MNPPKSEDPIIRMGSVSFIVGLIIIIVSTLFHPSSQPLTNHPLVFAEYAASDTWIGAHIGQFAGVMLVFAGGFVALYRLLMRSESPLAKALALLGLATAIITACTFAIIQAIDGIALKRAVDTWAASPADEKVITFRVAEAIRWIEIGTNGIFRILQGAAAITFGAAILMSGLLPRWSGGFGMLAGVSTIIFGIGIAYVGFADQPIVGMVSTVTSLLWLVILGILMWKKSMTKTMTIAR